MRTPRIATLLMIGSALCVAPLVASSSLRAMSSPIATTVVSDSCTVAKDIRWIVVFDSTTDPAAASDTTDAAVVTPARHRVFSFRPPGASCSTAAERLVHFLALATDSGARPSSDVIRNVIHKHAADSAVLIMRDSNAVLNSMTSARWPSHKGDTVGVYACVAIAGAAPKVNFAETIRASRIAADLTTLASIVLKLPKPDTSHTRIIGYTVLPPPRYACRRKRYVLQQERATLAISISPIVAGAKKDTSANAARADSVHVTLTTGPAEHLYLSANLGLTSAQQVSYDQGTKSLTPAKTPTAFYLGANWAFADLNADTPTPCGWQHAGRWASFWNAVWCETAHTVQGLSVGGFAEASTKPVNQAGALLGLRYLPLLKNYVALGTVTPYVGILWVRNESVVASSTTPSGQVSAHFGAGHPIVGISFNVSQALTWLSSGSTSKGSTTTTATNQTGKATAP